MEIRIDVRRLGWQLAAGVAVVLALGTAANFAITQVVCDPDAPLTKALNRFDLGHEPSLPNYLSALGHFACACMLLLIYTLSRQAGHKNSLAWLLLGLLFLCLSCDEAIMLHEMLDRPLRATVLGQWLFLPWVIVGGAFALAVGLGSIRLLISIDRRTCFLFVLAGAIFVAGAVGMETVASFIFQRVGSEEAGSQTLAHVVEQSIEEGLEMTGIAIFFWALVGYAVNTFHHVTISRLQPE